MFLNELGEDTEYQFVAKWLMDTELNHPDIGAEQGQWWDMQWQALELRLSDPNFGTEAPLVDEYFANQDGALDLLRVDAGDATLLRTQYLADQNSFLNDYITELGDEAVGIALKNVPGLTAAKLLKTVTGDLPEPTLAGYYEEYLLGESFHLAEHHFYGNKRLGIKYYWPATGWGWDATTGYIPYLNTWITSRVPWYSRAMNEFIQPDITEPRYNKLDYSSWFTSRLLGTKRFELTDHLGNVSSVILDRKTPVNTGSVLHKYDPDVQLVLDYYPYGMVMKEGYCDTCDPNAVTQSTGPALKMVNTDYTLLPQNYPPLTGTTVANWTVVTGGEAEPQEEGQLSWEGTGGGMLFTCLNEVNPGTHELGMTALMEVTAEEAHEIEIVVDIDDAGELEAKIISYTDPEHTEYDVLTSTKIPTSNGYLLQFTPTTDTVWLWIGRTAEDGLASGTKFKVTGTTTAKTTWTVYQMNIQGLLHSWRSPYRFAYNGQERVDDIKGKTNHNTALYGEYDTRRAWRWNRDPKPVLGVSPYAMFRGNPLWFNDPLLDVFKVANRDRNQEVNDVKSLAVSKDGKIDHSRNVNVRGDGTVELVNFSSQEEKERALKENIGLKLIDDLINAKDKETGKDYVFMYEVGIENLAINRRDRYTITDTKDVTNLSITPRNIDGGSGGDAGSLPPFGLSGYTRIKKGEMNVIHQPQLKLNRASLVYHELRENWYRTVMQLPYKRPSADPKYEYLGQGSYPGYDGAHNESVIDEGNFYGNPSPGGYHEIK